MEVFARLVFDEAGELAGTAGTLMDITERKRSEQQIIAARDEAHAANRAKSEFLSRMSHELRTPMNAVLGFGQLLEMDDLNEEQRESVGYIVSSGRHLLGLIDEVLDISRIEAGRVAVVRERFDPQVVVSQVMEMNRPAAAAAGIELRSGPKVTRWVYGDVQRTRQTLLNLVSNAIKYNRQMGSVTVSVTASGGRARISVADTGPGIPPEKLHRLFEPFDRLDAEFTAVPGTGLGLALSKALVEAMDGALTVVSVPGEGSVFTLELPLAIGGSAELPTAA